MIRKIISIDKEACNGCGLCAQACHEGAITIQDGKAVLIREDYCDGLGDCLPSCPTGAITFVEREAAAYDQEAVLKNARCTTQGDKKTDSSLEQWPVQIKLAPVKAPYFQGAHLLIAADCTAYAYGNFHRDFMKGKVTLIGCPKLDSVEYQDKLTAIFAENDIQKVTVVRMEVPCCSGMARAAENAVAGCGKQIPCERVVLSLRGERIE